MECELVSSSHSKKSTGVEDDESNTPLSYSECFRKYLPLFMLMGMSKDEYYNGDNTLTKDYRKLYDLKKQEMNYQLWLQGFYVYQAVASLVPLLQPYSKSTKVIPYMDKPLPITQDEIKQAKKDEEREQAELQKLKFLQMVNNINSNMSKEGEQGGRQ